MQLFSADAIVFSKQKLKIVSPQKSEKQASKNAHNRPRHFYFTVHPRPQQQYEISAPDICSLICGKHAKTTHGRHFLGC